MKKSRNKLSKQAIVTIAVCSLLVLAHVAVILAILLSFRYYSIYPSLFGSVVAIVVCLLIIVDIIFFVGFNHKDLALKIISLTLSVLMLVGGTVGSYFIAKTNGIVNSVLDSSSTKYETYSGVFVCYDKNNTYAALSDLSGKNVGMLAETSNGISYIAKNLLSDNKIDYALIEYNTNAELVTALLDGNIDAMVITSAYRTIYSLERDENSPFAQYLDNFVDFYSFEQELKVNSNKKAKNLNTDPFNVLLIGYSRTDIGSSVGLADSIIVATINPQTYTVSMMSIARDSFVPISCYGGEYDKINSGRSTSRACFIETVEDFLDMDIDYYMELDYLGLVQIVDTIGGVHIDNPVDFTLDGIYVPAGSYTADGQQALQFCRERHSMPNGDFDRQQHQKEVIIAIAKKLIESGSVSLALEAMDNASDWMSTDLTLNQLTTIFNLLLNTKNYTGLDTFDLVDFQTLRMTGSGGLMYYSYSMNLPLWVYLIYQGSYDESMSHLNEVMGNYDSYDQDYSFELSANCPYTRELFYSLEYDDVFLYTPDEMPAYWANLEGMTMQEAMAWAKENGVTLTVAETISSNDSRYDAELEGQVVDQSVRYGSLISEYKSGTITIMGAATIDESKVVPDFVGHSYTKAKTWAETYGIKCSVTFSTTVSGEVGDVTSQYPDAYTDIEDCDVLKIVVKAGEYSIKFNKNGHGKDTDVPSTITVTTNEAASDLPVPSAWNSNVVETDGTYVFTGWYASTDSTTALTSTSDVKGSDGSTVTLYAHWKKLVSITLDANGGDCSKTSIVSTDTLPTPTNAGYVFDGWYTQSKDGTKVTDLSTLTADTTLYAHWTCDHVWVLDETTTAATCTTDGSGTYKCSTCGETKTDIIEATGHSYEEIITQPDCLNGIKGTKKYTCKNCGDSYTEEIAADHTIVQVDAVAATCTTDGKTAGTKCSVCGTILSGCEDIKASGHVDADKDGICDVCEENITS